MEYRNLLVTLSISAVLPQRRQVLQKMRYFSFVACCSVAFEPYRIGKHYLDGGDDHGIRFHINAPRLAETCSASAMSTKTQGVLNLLVPANLWAYYRFWTKIRPVLIKTPTDLLFPPMTPTSKFLSIAPLVKKVVR